MIENVKSKTGRRPKIGKNMKNILYAELLTLVNGEVTRRECVDNIMRLIELRDEERVLTDPDCLGE